MKIKLLAEQVRQGDLFPVTPSDQVWEVVTALGGTNSLCIIRTAGSHIERHPHEEVTVIRPLDCSTPVAAAAVADMASIASQKDDWHHDMVKESVENLRWSAVEPIEEGSVEWYQILEDYGEAKRLYFQAITEILSRYPALTHGIMETDLL